MEGWQIALLIKAFALLFVLAFVRWLSWRILERLPEGRLKRILSFRWN